MAQPPEMISPPEEALFSVRIVTLDYYMASPIPDLDICFSSFHGGTVKEVPVIRIYGATLAGQKTCLHIHRALPFLYIPCPELLQSSQEGDGFIKDLMIAVEKALDQGVSTRKTQRIHGYSLVRAKKIYGYHSSEDLFLKIYLYYPHDVARAATMLLNGAILGRTFQPYESHIPYLLHFLIDHNLYGMSHIHTSKIKFRPPLPDSFQQRTASKENDTQADLGKEAVGDSAIWLSSTVSSSLIWPDPVISQCSSETLLANFPKRQSICELEGDASVDDILNEKNLIFTSVTQTKSEVMMVQSLIPIWEEFARSGVQEVAKPIEIMRPHPEHVLKNFQRGIQCENVLSELFAKMHKALPENVLASEVGEQFEVDIELQNGIAESLKFRGQQECKYSSCEPLNDHEGDTMFHGLPYQGQGVREKTSEFYEWASSKRTTPLTPIRIENEKSLSNEALGLLSWFASSQAAEDLNMDGEPVQEAIVTPLSSMKSYKEALDIAHLDYEHASQQECNDILDSVEYVFNPDVIKEHSSLAGYHEPMTGASSGDTIPQADGSSDDSYRTPPNYEVNVGGSEVKTSTGADVSVMNASVRFNKHKRRNCLWGPLPFSTTQKEHAYSESSLSPNDLQECDEFSSSSRSDGSRTCHNTSNTVTDTSGGMPLTSCSVRDLMRRKRHYREGYTEPERTFEAFSDAETNKKKQLFSEGSPTYHHVVLHNDIQMNMSNTQKARENFHDAHTSSHADYATKMPINDCRTVGISTSYPNNGMRTASDMGKTSMEFVEMTFRHGPPSKDQVTYLLEDSADATGNVTAHSESLVFDVNRMSTDLHGMKHLLHFFERDLKHKKLYQFPDEIEGCELQESALGIPTHFQNDGSILYLLSLATSPPSVDSVREWLMEVEQGKCSKNPNEGSHPSTLQSRPLKCLEGFKKTGRELDCYLHKTAKGDSNYISGTDCCEDPIPARNVPLLVNQDIPTLYQYHLGNEPVENCVHSDASLDKSNLSCTHMVQNFPNSSLQDMSQISGPDDKSFLTPLSQTGFRDPASVDGEQQLTIMSVEVLAESRGDLRPDPQFDGINIISIAVQEDTRIALTVYVLIRAVNDEPQCYRDKVTGCNISIFKEEKQLLKHFVKIIYSVDPDIVMGWEIQGGSLGFIAERASHLGINLIKSISRTPDHELKKNIGDAASSTLVTEISEASIANTVIQNAVVQDDWVTHASGLHVGGRIVLNIWRLMRNEVKLNMYSVEAVAEEVLRRKIPSIPYKVLNHCFSRGPGQLRHRSIQYLIERTKLNLEIMIQLDMINRTSELARIFGIDFFSVLSRGSQFRVESMLLRLAHAQNYLAISPGHQQVASQPAMECLPLVMEPESGFYEDPVIVLDFQSLYPSMMIAYNLCFSTCLGKVVPSKSDVLGVSSYSANLYLFKYLNELLLAPNGVMYVPSKVRKGVLPRLLEEILSTRIMIKQAMKKLKPSQQLLQRIFNARQLALKLIANVTYGYTAAGFTGRMPCAELADSVVQCGRRTLEEAISFVNEHPKWKAKVIYGDTDSMFVLLKGRNLEAAFGIGTEIANAITSINPDPVTLKLEKVYQPCFLLTKKRYVGYSYDNPGQEKPKFDAKGIETVRRDTCPAVAKLLENSIRLIFELPDVSRVKSYLWRQWTRILSGRVSFQDFIFAKEVHLGTYSTRISSLPPAAIVAIKAMNLDPRSEPRSGERVPYVVVHGEPGARLMDMVVDPHDLLEFDSPYRLNDHYYIKKQIIPALQRVLGLLGADLNQWFIEMPRPIKRLAISHLGSSHDFDYNDLPNSRKSLMKSRIDTYYSSKHCMICGNLVQSSKYLCDKCSEKKTLVATVIVGKTSMLERDIQHLAAICRHCGGGDWIPENVVQCNSLACSVFYERRKVQKELQVNSTFAVHAGLYPTCTAEWF